MRKDINLLILSSTLNVLTYPLILGIIKTNGLIDLSNFIPIKYLELVFVSINFQISVLSTLTSQILLGFFSGIKLFFYLFLSLQISPLVCYEKKFMIVFYLTDISIFLKILYCSSDFDLYKELI